MQIECWKLHDARDPEYNAHKERDGRVWMLRFIRQHSRGLSSIHITDVHYIPPDICAFLVDTWAKQEHVTLSVECDTFPLFWIYQHTARTTEFMACVTKLSVCKFFGYGHDRHAAIIHMPQLKHLTLSAPITISANLTPLVRCFKLTSLQANFDTNAQIAPLIAIASQLTECVLRFTHAKLEPALQSLFCALTSCHTLCVEAPADDIPLCAMRHAPAIQHVTISCGVVSRVTTSGQVASTAIHTLVVSRTLVDNAFFRTLTRMFDHRHTQFRILELRDSRTLYSVLDWSKIGVLSSLEYVRIMDKSRAVDLVAEKANILRQLSLACPKFKDLLLG